jgi:hypothetical protein
VHFITWLPSSSDKNLSCSALIDSLINSVKWGKKEKDYSVERESEEVIPEKEKKIEKEF